MRGRLRDCGLPPGGFHGGARVVAIRAIRRGHRRGELHVGKDVERALGRHERAARDERVHA